MTSLVVSEVFGPTFQGEGASLGLRSAFVRLGGCNLHCSWCDTPYTWDASRYDLREQMMRVPVESILDEVKRMQPVVVVVTGGEPMLWQATDGWQRLLDGLTCPVEVETNGTVAPTAHTIANVARFTVSPKLAHAGDQEDRRIRPDVLRAFARLADQGRADLKVVVRTEDDVRATVALAHEYAWPVESVYVMPEGTDAATLSMRHRALAQTVLDEGLNMTTRLQVLTWGAERGR